MTAAIATNPVVTQETSHEFTTHKFVRDVFYSNLPIPVQKLRTYLWLVVMTRALGAEGFGAWSLFILALSNATTIATLNCGSSLMRFMSGKRASAEVNQAFCTVLAMVGVATGILVLLLITFSGQVAAILFHSKGSAVLIALLAAALPLDCAFEEIRNLLRARRLNRSWALLSIGRFIPEIGATLIAAWWLRSVAAVSWAYLTIAAFSVGGGMIYLMRRFNFYPLRPSGRIAARYAKFGLPLLPGVLASAISLGADKYLVGYYLGLKQVGIYSVCFTISALTFFLAGPINDVLFPELSALHDAAQAEYFQRRFSGIQKFVFGFSMGAAAILVAFPHEVLRVFASGDFASGSATLSLLGVQGIFMAFVMLYTVILNVRLRVWSATAFWMVSGALIVTLDLVLLRRIGIEGAALSQLIATAAGAIFLIFVHRDLFRQTFDFNWLYQTGLAFALVSLVATVWQGPSLAAGISILRIATGASVFLSCLFATGFIRLDDLRMMREAVV